LCGLRKAAVSWAVCVSDGPLGTRTCMADNSEFNFKSTSWKTQERFYPYI